MTKIAVGTALALLVGCQGPTEPEPGVATYIPEEIETGTELTPLDLGPAAVPVTGGHLALVEGTDLVAIADPHEDRFLLVDWKTGEQVGASMLPANSHAGRVAQGLDGTIWVALRRGARVLGFSPEDGAQIAEVGTCAEPRGLAPADDGSMWVACAAGTLVQFDVDGLIDDIPLLPDLRDVVVDAVTGGLWVSRFKSADLMYVEPGGAIRHVPMPQLYEPLAPTFFDQHFVPAVAWSMVGQPGGGVVIAHQRERTSLVDIRKNPLPEAPPPYYGPVDPSPVPTPTPPSTDPDTSSCTGIIHGALTRISAIGQVPSTTAPIRAASVPADLALGPDGEVYVAAAGANLGTAAPASVVEVGVRAWGSPAFCYEPADLVPASSSVFSSVVVAPTGEVIALGAQPLTLLVDGASVMTDPTFDPEYGFQRFHRNPSFGVTCAGCHPEGHEDGHAWAFRTDTGDILRRTQALGGNLLQTGPFHWDGEFETFAGLMDEVWGRRMGGDELPPAEIDELADYIDAIPAPRSTPHDAALVAEGKAQFERAGCATCHSGPYYTNNETYDVGTGEPLQVPSLIGVAARLPVMHDGCAVRLQDRFDPDCGGTQHGNVYGLSDQAIDAMVAFLETL